MKLKYTVAFAVYYLLFHAAAAIAQQVVNPNADVAVASPTWKKGAGPRVLIDGAHRNFHTIDEGYAPFAALLRNDGYRVVANTHRFASVSLDRADILVIANAVPPDGVASAFEPDEIDALKRWVCQGGSLLLVADHKPFAGAASSLAQAFGVNFRDEFAVFTGVRGQDIFRKHAGLAEHVITRGAGGDPPVLAVRSFLGSAFEAPAAAPVFVLTPEFALMAVRLPDAKPDEPRMPAAGLLQGGTMNFGRGRVAIMGEAAMFTSQLSGPDRKVIGFGAPGAHENAQFTLNLLHWLSRKPGY